MPEKLYAQRDIESDELSGHYMRHLDHMTTENLREKSEIAAELAWRDAEIERLTLELAHWNDPYPSHPRRPRRGGTHLPTD